MPAAGSHSVSHAGLWVCSDPLTVNRWMAPEMAPFSNLCPRIADKLPQKLLSTREPFSIRFLLLTLHPKANLAQVLINGPLCTSCAGAAHLVEGRGKTGEEDRKCAGSVALPNIAGRPAKRPDPGQKRLPQRQFGTPRCEIGFRRGFSQLTFRPDGGKYSRQVFQLSEPLRPGTALGSKKNLPRRKNE